MFLNETNPGLSWEEPGVIPLFKTLNCREQLRSAQGWLERVLKRGMAHGSPRRAELRFTHRKNRGHGPLLHLFDDGEVRALGAGCAWSGIGVVGGVGPRGRGDRTVQTGEMVKARVALATRRLKHEELNEVYCKRTFHSIPTLSGNVLTRCCKVSGILTLTTLVFPVPAQVESMDALVSSAQASSASLQDLQSML